MARIYYTKADESRENSIVIDENSNEKLKTISDEQKESFSFEVNLISSTSTDADVRAQNTKVVHSSTILDE